MTDTGTGKRAHPARADTGADLAEIRLENFGMWADHNMPCAICLQRPAVFDCQRGFFSPCWGCQEEGWQTTRASRAIQGFMSRKSVGG